MKKLFDEQQLWYRGNLHTHTNISDGKVSPEEAIALYKAKGYDFMAITDHRDYYGYWEEEGFTLLGGTELDSYIVRDCKALHVVGIGITRAPEHVRGDSAAVMVKSIRDAGGLPILAHPQWSLLTHDDMLGLDGLFATEIYNGVSKEYNGRGDSSGFADVCMSKGCVRMLVGVDDTHCYERDLFSSWIMLKSPSLSRTDLLSSLEKGSFYASDGGPCFRQIYQEKDLIRVECEPCARIIFHTDLFGDDGRVHVADDKLISQAEYKAQPDETHVRVQLIGADGGQSTSQYIRVNA